LAYFKKYGYFVIFGIENLASSAIIALTMGPSALTYLCQLVNEIIQSGHLLLNACSNEINNLLRILKKTNHKAYLLLLKAYIAMQHKKSRQQPKTAKITQSRKVSHFAKSIFKTSKNWVSKIKASIPKVKNLKETTKLPSSKSFVKAVTLSHEKAHKPTKTYALKSAINEIGKKEYLKIKEKSAAKHSKA
jgi:hypothetical protein